MSYQEKIREARGSGGGGGKDGGGAGAAPIEAPDSLRSKQLATVLDLICEGEISGLIDGAKSVYLDGTPLQNADGTYNFKNVTLNSRNGTQDQTYMPGFGDVRAEVAVGVEVTNAVSVVRTITNRNVDAVSLTIGIPQLTLQDTTTGDLNGTSVTIAIDVQDNGGGYVAQPLRKTFRANAMAIGSTITSNTVSSSKFRLTVDWTGQTIQAPQSCTFKLQYREQGDTTWLDYTTHTFESGYNVNPLTGTGSSIGGLAGQQLSSQGSKTFNITLAEGDYEFRAIKTTGSVQGALGILQSGAAYGGTVAITSGEAYVPTNNDVISGKTTSRYQRAYRIELTGTGPWDIRVRRITADSTQVVLQNKTFWDSYTEIIDSKLSYPNSALIGIQIDAKQFRNIPTRGYHIRGLLVQVPSNYDPVLRTYTGSWDGTFVTAYSNNPAWCMYDLLTNDRYGLGQFLAASQVDKWALYNIAQYCDEMVDDGFGGLEPRFTLNLYLQTREQAYNVIANLASVFRAISYWSAGTITTVQDAPADPVALFTCANVIDGTFNYSGSDAKTRHTVVLVTWNDPSDQFRQKIEYVEDADAIARYGVIQSEVAAFGCTSRGQAHRYGRAIIYSEQMESETVTFRAGLYGTLCYPGAIIRIQDQFRAGQRLGGRVLSATTTEVALDHEVTLESGKVYTLTCVLPDGSIEDVTVTNSAGTTDTLAFDPAFTEAPQQYAIWMITTPTLQTTTWRVISMAESEKYQVEITALAYREDKYAAIEENLVLEPINFTSVRVNPDPVSNLQVEESLTLVGLGLVGVKATVSWDASSTAVSYIVQYVKSEQNIVELTTENTSIDISPLEEGDYEFTVIAVNSIGRRSISTTVDVTIYGKTIPPVDVEDFSVIKNNGMALGQWSLHDDLDVRVGGQIVIRHSPLTTGATWQDGVILEAFDGNTINGLLPLMTGTYMAKALDSSGNWSESMVSFVATEGMVTGFNTVATLSEHPDFDGVRDGTSRNGDVLQLSGALTIGEMTDPISTWPKLTSLGGIISTGTYEFHEVMDLGSVATRRFESTITPQSFDTGDRISERGLVSTWGSVTGETINDCDATLLISITDDDPAGTPSWGPYAPFFVADFTCRAARFKLQLDSGTVTHNIRISELTVRAKEPA